MPAPGSTPDPSHYPDGLGFSGSKLLCKSLTCFRAFFRNSLRARSAGALTALLLASGTSVPDVFEHVLAQCLSRKLLVAISGLSLPCLFVFCLAPFSRN